MKSEHFINLISKQHKNSHLIDTFIWSRDFKTAIFLPILPKSVIHSDVVAINGKFTFLLFVCGRENASQNFISYSCVQMANYLLFGFALSIPGVIFGNIVFVT